MPTAGKQDPIMTDEFFVADFSGVDEAPSGVLLLTLTKYGGAMSSKNNRMVNVQLKVAGGEDDKFNGRMVFDSLMLETDARFRTVNFFKAFLGEMPKAIKAAFESALGQSVWCLVIPEEGKGEYAGTVRPRIQKYGVKAPSA
jgi:hypothetical protein